MNKKDEISLSIEESNKLRISLGIAPLQTGTENEAEKKEKKQVENRLEHEEKRKREVKRREVKEAVAMGKILGSGAGSGNGTMNVAKAGLGAATRKRGADIDDASAWAAQLGKKQIKTSKKLERQRQKDLEATISKEYGEEELQGLKVGHRLDDLDQETILVLKDSTINDDNEEDELVNMNIADLDAARKAELVKKGPKKHDPYEDFDRQQMGLDKKILSYYDDPTADDEADRGFILGKKGTVDYSHEMRAQEEKKVLGVVPLGGVALDYEKSKEMADFYTREEVMAFKKPKKKRKSTKRKALDVEGDYLNGDADALEESITVHESFANSNKTLNIENANFVDDDDLQALLAKTRQKANKKNNVALRVLEEAAEQALEMSVEDEEGGLVISDLTEFVGNLSAIPTLKPSGTANQVTSVNADLHHQEVVEEVVDMEIEDDHVLDNELEEGEEEEEDDHLDLFNMAQPASKGLAATLSLLQAKGDIKQSTDEEKQRNLIERERLEWLSEQRRKDALEQRSLERERELRKDGGKKPRIDEWERQMQVKEAERIKAVQVAKRFEGYKPNFDITYRDAHGRELNSKEAFKELAQKFHGHKSGKKKTEKKLLKIQEEIKIKNMYSTDTLLQSTHLFANQAEKSGSAHLTLSKGGKSVVPEVDLSTLKSSSGPKSSSASTSDKIKETKPSSSQSSKPQGFSIVQPEPSAPLAEVASALSAVPVSRPKVAFGLSMKKGKMGNH